MMIDVWRSSLIFLKVWSRRKLTFSYPIRDTGFSNFAWPFNVTFGVWYWIAIKKQTPCRCKKDESISCFVFPKYPALKTSQNWARVENINVYHCHFQGICFQRYISPYWHSFKKFVNVLQMSVWNFWWNLVLSLLHRVLPPFSDWIIVAFLQNESFGLPTKTSPRWYHISNTFPYK